MAALLALPVAARAAGGLDPALAYRTVASERLRVHYPPGAFNLAVRVSRAGERLLSADARLFGNLPQGLIDVVLLDNADQANGSAQVLPKNIVRLFLTAPTELTGLSAYDDWIEMLLAHELAHLCDLDQSRGPAAWLAAVFGRSVRLNSGAPPWLTEGSAVWAETALTTTGRGRSSYVEMMLRTAALDGRFLRIDQAHRYYPTWPGGNVPYFYGGRFHLWLAGQVGNARVAELHQRMSAWPLGLYWAPARAALGATLDELWRRWAASEVDFANEVAASVRAAGETPTQALTGHGGDIAGASWTAAGDAVIYSRQSPVDGATVRRLDLATGRDNFLVLEAYSARLAVEPDGSGVFFAQAAVNARYDTYNDLRRLALADGRVERVVDDAHPDRRLRARDPALHPAGDRLAFVRGALHQSELVEARFVDASRRRLSIRTLVGAAGDLQMASPAYAPDGRTLALSAWEPGRRRNIIIVSADDGRLLRRVTLDQAEDSNPSWSPSGRYLLYESDSDGISNLYAFDVQRRAYYRVTRVVGGASAAQVHPQGHTLLMRLASGAGFDLATVPFDPSRWEPQRYRPGHGYEPAPSPQTLEEGAWVATALPSAAARAAEPPLALGPGERDSGYLPWPSVLPFQHNWYLRPMPQVLTTTPLAATEVGATLLTGGSDVLERHAWAVGVGTSRYGRRANWLATYQWDRYLPTVSLAVADAAVVIPVDQGRFAVQRTRSAQGGIQLVGRRRHSVGLAYGFERRRGSGSDAGLLALGDFASLQGSYTYRLARQFPLSISPEHGRQASVLLRWLSPRLGGSFEEVIVGLDGRAWLALPWADNHVLAARLSAALALGPRYQERFYLGGTVGVSSFSSPAPRQLPLRGLRASPASAGVVAGYLEYRAPLWQIHRGLSTLPLLARTLHAAAFADAGAAFLAQSDSRLGTLDRDIRAGAERLIVTSGAELRLDLLLNYALVLTLRLGVAAPWWYAGAARFDRQQLLPYLDLGTVI